MRLRNGWRAGYAEMCKSGSEGGSRKPDLEIDQGGGFLPNKNERLLLRDACYEYPLSLLMRLLSKWLKP